MRVALTVESRHLVRTKITMDKTAGNPIVKAKLDTSLRLFRFFTVRGAAKIIGMDLTKIARLAQRTLLTRPIEDTERIRKQIAIESNMPQIAEIIIVNGENSQNDSTQNPDCGFLDLTYEYRR